MNSADRSEGITLGHEVRRFRTLLGFTTAELAARSDLREAYLLQIEDDRAEPSDEALRRLAEQLAPAGATYDGLTNVVPTKSDEDIFAETNRLNKEYREKVRKYMVAEGIGLMGLGFVHFG